MEIELTYWNSLEAFWLRLGRRLEIWRMAVGEAVGLAVVGESAREDRFRAVIRDYGSMISGICFSFSTSEQDAADLRQDILLNIWKGLATYREEAGLSTWLYRVALNTCVSTVRKRKTRIPTVVLETAEDCGAPVDSDERERVEWLYSRIASLPPLDKAIVTMWLDERPYEEIAQVTGISRNNVAVRLNRIKQKLGENM